MRSYWVCFVALVLLLFGYNPARSEEPVAIRITDSDHAVTVNCNGEILASDISPDTYGTATAHIPKREIRDVTLGVVTPSGSTETTPPTSKKDPLSTINLDRPISAVPAFTALDVSPETVSQPSTPRELGAALLNGVDHHGVLQTGLAIETAPFRVLHMMPTDIRSYQTPGGAGYWNRFLYNFSVSAATTKASEKSDAVQLAVGFSALLYQDKESDPRTSEGQEKIFRLVNEKYPMLPSGEGIPEESAEAKKILQDAADEFRKDQWKGVKWAAAIAPTWTSESGKISDLGSTGFAAWTTAAYGWQDALIGESVRGQLLAQARYRKDEFVVDPNNKTHTAKQDTFIAAARLRLGSVDFNAFGEAGYFYQWRGLNGDGGGCRAAGGIEKRITNNMWLVLSAGEQFGSSAVKTDELYAIGSIRIGTADTPQLGSGQ